MRMNCLVLFSVSEFSGLCSNCCFCHYQISYFKMKKFVLDVYKIKRANFIQ